MKTYTVYLIRHALTQGNLEGRYIGQTDESLCKEGIEQLEAIAAEKQLMIVDELGGRL